MEFSARGGGGGGGGGVALCACKSPDLFLHTTEYISHDAGILMNSDRGC